MITQITELNLIPNGSPIRIHVDQYDEGVGRLVFRLYEDDGEDLGYLRGEFLRTPVSCHTSTEGYEIEIGERDGSGYKIAGKREFIFRIYTDALPKIVTIDGVKAKKNKIWSADKKAGECTLHIADDGKKHTIKLIF